MNADADGQYGELMFSPLLSPRTPHLFRNFCWVARQEPWPDKKKRREYTSQTRGRLAGQLFHPTS